MNENSNFSGSNDNTSKAEQKRAIEKAERKEVRKEQQDTDVFDDGLDEKLSNLLDDTENASTKLVNTCGFMQKVVS